VDSKAKYSGLSSTRRQKKKLKQPTPVPLTMPVLKERATKDKSENANNKIHIKRIHI